MLTPSPKSGADTGLPAEHYDRLFHSDFLGCIDSLAEKSAEVAADTRRWLSSCLFDSPAAVYWNPAEKRAGYSFGQDVSDDAQLPIAALLADRFGVDNVEIGQLGEKHASGFWVKIAYSPSLRALGEILHYYPSKHVNTGGGHPVAAVVASSLLGTGLGYGAGALYEKIMPEWAVTPGETRRRFARNGALIGAGVGAVPGVFNLASGRRFSDPTLFNHQADEPWQGAQVPSKLAPVAAKIAAARSLSTGTLAASDGPAVQVDALGRVLQGGQTTALLQAMTLGAMYGASQIDDPTAQPGEVTPHQLGMFGMLSGAAGGGLKGYVAGRMVGASLGALTALPPQAQDTLARTGAVAGVLNSLVPQLFR